MADNRGMFESVQERVAKLWGRVRQIRQVEATRSSGSRTSKPKVERSREEDVFELTVMSATDRSEKELKRYMDRFDASPTAEWLRQHHPDGPEAFARELNAAVKTAQADALRKNLISDFPTAETLDVFLTNDVPDRLQDALHHAIGNKFVDPVAQQQGLESFSSQASAVFDQYRVDAPESWSSEHSWEISEIAEWMPESLLVDLADVLSEAERARFDEHRAAVAQEAVAWVFDARPVPTPGASIYRQFEDHAVAVMKDRAGVDLAPQMHARREAFDAREARHREVWPRQQEVMNRFDETTTGKALSDYNYRYKSNPRHSFDVIEAAFEGAEDIIAAGVVVPEGMSRADLFEQRFKVRMVDALVPFLDQVPADQRDAAREQAEKDLASALRPSDLPTRQVVEAAVAKALAPRAEPAVEQAVQTETKAAVQVEVPSVESVARAARPAAEPVVAAPVVAAAAVAAPAAPAPAPAVEPVNKALFGAFQKRGGSSTPADGPALAQADASAVAAAPAAGQTAAPAVERPRTGPWDDFPGQWNQKLYESWRARYADAANNVAMSPRADAPDGFVKNAKGERKGLFDSEAFLKGLPDGLNRAEQFSALEKAYTAHREDVAHSRHVSRTQGDQVGTVRLDLVKGAEDASFHAERSALLRSREPGLVAENREKARATFGELFSYDAKHGHPITDPDRDLKTGGATVQEQWNWLARKDVHNDQEVGRKLQGTEALGTVASELSLFEDLMTGQGEVIVGQHRSAIGYKPLQVTPLERTQHVAPQAMRTAIATEHAEEIAAKNQLAAELKDAQREVAAELAAQKAKEAQAQAILPFTPEPDKMRTRDEFYVRGTLVEHGERPYPKLDNQPYPSATVALRDGTTHTLWGKELPNAIHAGGVQAGDTVELRGQTPQAGDERMKRVNWVAQHHDFAQHEADQRTAHEAQHGKVQEVVFNTVEERMASWLDVNVQDPAQYVPLARDQRAQQDQAQPKVLADVAVGQTKTVAHEEITGEAQRQADLQAAKNVPLSSLNADVLDEGITSIQVKGFTSDSVAYSFTMGGQSIDGFAKWDREANGLDGAASTAIVNLTAGARLDRAMGGPLGLDDRELVDAVLHEHLEAQTKQFVHEHGHQVAPIEVLAPDRNILASRIDARAQGLPQAEQDQGEAQSQGKQGKSQGGAGAPAPTVQAVDPGAPRPLAGGLSDYLDERSRAFMNGDPSVSRLEPISGKPVQTFAQIEALTGRPAVDRAPRAERTGDDKALDSITAMLGGGAQVTAARKEILTEVNPALPLGPQVQAHNEATRNSDNSIEAKRLWESLGVRGPKADAAQRARLGLPEVATAQTQGQQAQQNVQEQSLGHSLSIERRR
ncbi:hypothetical protein SAMN05216466_106206 [Paraburkholderia phenazinium]|uniref:Uncharacterized protein n=1 Tax=Paraburkholderia phenazinium TaxID=60549 RepID=A0A1G7YIH4_9BURK|nr:hypothetical protein [Paraburkholderia phenazinium]SDG96368.1 hypothetical protein SAMN05216466_106206 [Paraburkholderia phenazinium]